MSPFSIKTGLGWGSQNSKYFQKAVFFISNLIYRTFSYGYPSKSCLQKAFWFNVMAMSENPLCFMRQSWWSMRRVVKYPLQSRIYFRVEHNHNDIACFVSGPAVSFLSFLAVEIVLTCWRDKMQKILWNFPSYLKSTFRLVSKL